MFKVFVCFFLTLFLTGCTFFRVHRNDVEQGNIIISERVSQLRIGMSEFDVKHLMGTPLYINIFTPNRYEYIYTMQRAHQPRYERKVICVFEGGQLARIL